MIPNPLDYLDRRIISIAHLMAVFFVIALPASEWRNGMLMGLCVGGVALGLLAWCAIRDIKQIMTAVDVVRACHAALHEHVDGLVAERDAWKAEAERLREFSAKVTGVRLK